MKEEKTQEYIIESLEKLAYTRSDRASNEKLANTLLNEWPYDVLKNSENDAAIITDLIFRLGVSTVSKTLRKSILCKCISVAVSNKALKRLSL
jgi:hypothetical protein